LKPKSFNIIHDLTAIFEHLVHYDVNIDVKHYNYPCSLFVVLFQIEYLLTPKVWEWIRLANENKMQTESTHK